MKLTHSNIGQFQPQSKASGCRPLDQVSSRSLISCVIWGSRSFDPICSDATPTHNLLGQDYIFCPQGVSSTSLSYLKLIITPLFQLCETAWKIWDYMPSDLVSLQPSILNSCLKSNMRTSYHLCRFHRRLGQSSYFLSDFCGGGIS